MLFRSIFFGWLSDKIGRKKIIMAGCLLAICTYFPLFKALTHYVNPQLEAATAKTPITMAARDCNFHIFVGPWSKFTDCDKAKDFLTKQGISFTSTDLPAGGTDSVVTKVGDVELKGFDAKAYAEALKAAGYPPTADKSQVDWVMTELIIVIMVLYVTMVYGPIAAFLVELFPARIRYTSMSLPYHIGNGWFGGLLPATAFAIVASTGDIYAGLWYPIIFATATFIIGFMFLPETKDVDITK